MALTKNVATPSGVATYHTVGEQGFDWEWGKDAAGLDVQVVSAAWCVLNSYPDELSRRDPTFDPWITTRFDLPEPIDGNGSPLSVAINQPAFYAYISRQVEWSDAVAA